jgi:hypothetical protein
MWDDAIEIGSTQVNGVHATTKEISHDLVISLVSQSKCLADRASRSIGADEIGCLYRQRPSVGNPLNLRLNSARVLGKANELTSKVDRNAWKLFGMPAQYLLNELLRNPVWKFGGAPRTG